MSSIARTVLDSLEVGPYLSHWIFLHFINRELGLGVGRGILFEAEALEAIRLTSVVLGTNLFCNVSQIHEHIADCEGIISELIFLSSIGRFQPHSDYGSYNEFLESRQAMYSHDAARYPFFFQEPPALLKRLPHVVTGKSASATHFIETGLDTWIEGHPNNALFGMLTSEDADFLRLYDRQLSDRLSERDTRAMTFSLFAGDIESNEPRRFEGALRRALSSLYVQSYRSNAVSLTISGLPGFEYFDPPESTIGTNFQFMRSITRVTGVSDFLSKRRNFGRKHRELIEHSDTSYHFRTAYARLAQCYDEIRRHRLIENAEPLSGYEVNSIVANHFRSSQSARPDRDLAGLFSWAADGFESLVARQQVSIHGFRRPYRIGYVMNGSNPLRPDDGFGNGSSVSNASFGRGDGSGGTMMNELETVVFATANLRESQAVVDYLVRESRELGVAVSTNLDDKLPHQEGRLPGKNIERRAVVVRADDTGPQEAVDLLRRILDRFTPSYIFFVGCAALLDEKQEPGENMVFVARRAIDVDKREETDGGVLYDMEQATGDVRVLRNIDALNTARQFEPLNVVTNRYFLSGSAFLRARKSGTRKAYIKDLPQDAVVLEMESFAVIKAVQARRIEGLDVVVSIIKGISDTGDENAQHGKDEAQRIATTNAMTVADKLLKAL